MKNSGFEGMRVLMIHFRVGRTDGVSLEITAWKEILEKAGATVLWCAGPISTGADYVIEALEQQLNPDVFAIDEDAFGGLKTFTDTASLDQAILAKQAELETELIKVLADCRPDRVMVSNVWSVGEHVAAAGALTRALDRFGIPTLGIHHDFYWDNGRCESPTSALVRSLLKEFFPSRREWLKHACINSIARKELKRRKGLDAGLIYDTLDFNQPEWKKDDYNEDLLHESGVDENDVVVLQATRTVRRKNIELAIDLVAQLNLTRNRMRLEALGLYDGRPYRADKNQAVLILAGYAEKRDGWYLEALLRYAFKKKVKVVFLGDVIGGSRLAADEMRKKNYALWDAYPFADLVTYPSEREGFGNQLLEAVFARKPVVVFEYPVLVSDILPHGFEFISMGNRARYHEESRLIKLELKELRRVTGEAVAVLTDAKAYRQVVEKNFRLGEKHFSYKHTLKTLQELLL